MNTETQKSKIIKRFRKIKDPELLKTFDSLVEYALKKQEEREAFSIPESHKKIVRKRILSTKQNQLTEWNKAKRLLQL